MIMITIMHHIGPYYTGPNLTPFFCQTSSKCIELGVFAKQERPLGRFRYVMLRNALFYEILRGQGA